MKKISYIIIVFAFVLISCGGNTEHKITVTGENVDTEKNSDWIKDGNVSSLICFINHGEEYYRKAESTTFEIYYRYVDGKKQYSASGDGRDRLVRNPYSNITVKPKNGETYTLNVCHYAWCCEYLYDSYLCIVFIPEL